MGELRSVAQTSGENLPPPEALDPLRSRSACVAHIHLTQVEFAPGEVSLAPVRQDSALVVFPVSGGSLIGRVPAERPPRRIDVGEAIYLSTRASHVAWWDETVTLLVARVAVRETPQAGGGRGREPASALFRASHLVQPTRCLLESLLDAGERVDPVTERSLASAAEHMIDSLFGERTSREWVRSRVPVSLFSQASSMMAATCADPAVTPESVAGQLAVSMRHLQRAFRSHGTSPARELRRLRLDTAVRLLRADVDRTLTVAEVAMRAGFATVDAFRRALHAENLPTPSQLRVAEPPGGAPRRGGLPDGWRFLGAPTARGRSVRTFGTAS